jgi:hypothetical protein
MELWKALMRPIIEDSSEPNGFEVTDISDLNPRTLSSFTTGIIVTASSKERHLYSSSEKTAMCQSCRLQSSNSQKSTISPKEQSLSSDLFEVTGNSISLENISNFPKNLSIPMSELKLLPACIRFKPTRAMIWLLLFHTVYQHGLPQISNLGNLCTDIC